MHEPRPPSDPDAHRQARRSKLAELIGRLLARYWLRQRQKPPESPAPALPQSSDNSTKTD